MLPRPIRWALIALGVLALLPIACIYRARNATSPQPRVHIVQDMDNQPKFKAQRVNPMFADGRAQRAPVAGTVARGQARDDDHFYRGLVGGAFATSFPEGSPVTPVLLARGRERYDIFCGPCPGATGLGNGTVVQRGFKAAASHHIERLRNETNGYWFDVITNGFGVMPPAGPQIPVKDRWAIVAYVRALQLSRHAALTDIPEAQREVVASGQTGPAARGEAKPATPEARH
jgi:mono/diheme cytochrome c family protein